MGKKPFVEPETRVVAVPGGEPTAEPAVASASAPRAPARKKAAWIAVRSPHGLPFWERHPDQPNGEVWVAGHDGQAGPGVEVALTPAVERALKDGRLQRVPGGG